MKERQWREGGEWHMRRGGGGRERRMREGEEHDEVRG